jgi:hypothetical protein
MTPKGYLRTALRQCRHAAEFAERCMKFAAEAQDAESSAAWREKAERHSKVAFAAAREYYDRGLT